jgi:hypothetical protein
VERLVMIYMVVTITAVRVVVATVKYVVADYILAWSPARVLFLSYGRKPCSCGESTKISGTGVTDQHFQIPLANPMGHTFEQYLDMLKGKACCGHLMGLIF